MLTTDPHCHVVRIQGRSSWKSVAVTECECGWDLRPARGLTEEGSAAAPPPFGETVLPSEVMCHVHLNADPEINYCHVYCLPVLCRAMYAKNLSTKVPTMNIKS